MTIGITLDEVVQARGDRTVFRLNLEFNGRWAGRQYRVRQAAPVVVEERDRILVVTVYTFYF